MHVRLPALVMAGLFSTGLGGAAVWSVWPAPPPASMTEAPREADEPALPANDAGPPLSEEDRLVAEEVARELSASTVWDHDVIVRVHDAFGGRKSLAARPIWQHAGFAPRSARRLSMMFSGPPSFFEDRLGKRLLLFPAFVRNGAGEWELSPITEENLRLPFHPLLPWPLSPVAKDGLRGQYERCDAIGRHRFMSGTFTDALRCTFRFRAHRFRITTGTDLLHDDWSFADRLDHALSVVPDAHLALVEDIFVDPGDHPLRHAAQTSSDGRAIHLYLAGAGKKVLQRHLDETTVHEVGHVVSLQQDARFWERWDAAILRDGFGVSAYGLTNHREDFAEAYLLYVGSGSLRSGFFARIPARLAEMTRLLATLE